MASYGVLCFSQSGSAFIDYDINVLERLGSSYGLDSREYNDRLLDLSLQYSDTCYHACYAYFANAIIDNNDNLRSVYGVDSPSYRQAMVVLDKYFLLGKYCDENYSGYEQRAAAVLLGLKKYLKQVSSNKEEFLSILSGVFRSLNGMNKALEYSKERLEIAEKNKLQDPTNYSYALSSYIIALCENKAKDANHEMDEITEAIGMYLDEYVMANSASPQSVALVISNVMNSLPTDMPSSVYRTLAERYCLVNGSLQNIRAAYLQAANENRVDVLEVLEEVCVPAERDKVNVVKFYLIGGICVGELGGNYELAADYMTKAIVLAESIGRKDLCYISDGTTLLHHWSKVSEWYTQLGQHDQAIEAQQKAVAAIMRDCGRTSQEWIDGAKYLSALYNAAGDYDKELQIDKELLDVHDVVYGRESAEYRELLLGTAGAYRECGRAAEALELLGSIDPGGISGADFLFEYYNQCGLCHISTWDYVMACDCFDKALEYGSTDEDRVVAMRNKISVLGDMGLYQRQAQELEELLRFAKRSRSIPASDIFRIYDDLGSAWANVDETKAMRYFDEAERYYSGTGLPAREMILHYQRRASAYWSNSFGRIDNLNKAVDLFLSSGHSDGVLLGVLKRDIGDYYSSIHNYRKAVDCYSDALELLKGLDYGDEQLLTLLNNFALNISHMGEYEQSAIMLGVVCQIRESTLGKWHPVYQISLRNLLAIYISAGDTAQADSVVSLCRDALSAQPSTESESEILFYEAEIAELKGENDKAVEMYRRAKSLNPDLAARVDQCLCSLFLEEGSPDYVATLRGTMKAAKEVVIQSFCYTSEEERRSQLPILEYGRNMVMKGVDKFPETTADAFLWNLFTKGLLFHTSAEINKILSKSPDGKAKWNELRMMRQRLNAATANGDSAAVTRLRSEAERAERELNNEFVSFKKLRDGLDVQVKDVLRGIGDKGLAVDFVRYNPTDSTCCYGAFLYARDMDVTLVPVCEESELLAMAKTASGQADFKFYTNSRAYHLIWDRLEEYFAGYDDIYFSADGALNTLAIELMCDDDNVPLCDKYRLHRTFHLADISRVEGLGDTFVAVGVSDYNSPVGGEDLRDRGSWSDLPGVRAELDTIANTLRATAERRVSVSVALDNEARETYVKSLSGRPLTSLHIATHGFYLGREDMTAAAAIDSHFNHNISLRALTAGKESLSGLIMRGGNVAWRSDSVGDDDDDILTSDEIECLTFPRLRLTVLSACETGLGDTDSDGVWGLQRAFRMAGSHSLICSLCNINDKWTARFMEVFYRRAAGGDSVYDAFQAARRHLFEQNNRKPQIWSSMILIE